MNQKELTLHVEALERDVFDIHRKIDHLEIRLEKMTRIIASMAEALRLLNDIVASMKGIKREPDAPN